MTSETHTIADGFMEVAQNIHHLRDVNHDLLEALKDVTDDLEAEIEARRGTVLERTTERDLASVRKARAAIAKAEGRS